MEELEEERGNLGYAASGGFGIDAASRQTKGGKAVGGGVPENGKKRERIASNEMCTFLILNISSLQLIPVNMIAYR